MPSPWRRFNRALKRLAEEEPTGLLDWLSEVLSIPGPVTLLDANLSKELVDTVREVDVVWRAARENRPFLLHLEFQLKRDEPGRAERCGNWSQRPCRRGLTRPCGRWQA